MESVISFTDVVSKVASDTFAAALASKNGLKALNDLYHLQMAIREHGEEKVVQETARVLKERYRVTYAEAAADAGHRVRSCLELVAGINTFKTVRENLNRD